MAEAVETGEISGPWVDPGDTMGPSTAIQVTLREAIVRRNHRVERSSLTGCVEIDWARSNELSLKRIARGVLRIAGWWPKLAHASIGIDGLAFRVAIPPETSAAHAIAERLSAHYQVEIIAQSDGSALLVLTGFAPILR